MAAIISYLHRAEVWGKYFHIFYVYLLEHSMLAATKVTSSKPKQGTLWCYGGNMTFPSLATQYSEGQQTEKKSD